jgi:hydroxymethylpyrimidine/phosphomethylpyrimidine kinase
LKERATGRRLGRPAGKPGVLVSVAGFDPSGGAGVLLDLRVFQARGFRGMAVLTGLTVQDTRGVFSVRPLPAPFVLSQFRALAADVAIAGVKVGMLGSRANLAAAARILEDAAGSPRVVDPVLRSTSGADLLAREAVPGFLRAVRGRLSVLTPNISEASRLTKLRVGSVEEMAAAARRLAEAILAPCLVTGGHLEGGPVNVLFDGARTRLYASPRLPGRVHGTGCYFSSALLAALAGGADLDAACRRATRLTRDAFRRAETVGRGRLLP